MRKFRGFVVAALCASLPLVFAVSGCGGGSSGSSAANNPAALTAKAETSPASVLLTWVTPTLPSGANVIEYKLFRDGSVIATPAASATTYTDSTAASAGEVTFTTLISSPSTQPSSSTISTSAVTTGVAHTYSLSIVYTYAANGFPEYYEVTVGNSSSVTLPSSSS